MRHRVFAICSFASIGLAALANVGYVNPTPVGPPAEKPRPCAMQPVSPAPNPTCPCDCQCAEGVTVENDCIHFAQAFGRSPLVTGAPTGKIEIFEIGAGRLSSGREALRFNHPMMRRIVERDEANGLVTIEEANGWLVHYRNGVPVRLSSGADLELRKDPATGQYVEMLEDRTLVFYDERNVVDHVVTPAGVRLDSANWGMDVVLDGPAIRQVRSETDGLMDVVKRSRGSFCVAWYPPSQVPGTKTGRLYDFTGTPAKTFTFEYAFEEGAHQYRLSEHRNDAFHFEYLWTSSNGGLDWTLTRDPGGLAIADSVESVRTEGWKKSVRTYSDAMGHARRVTETYRATPNGATLVGRGIPGADGSETALWGAARFDTGASAGRLACRTNETGGVTTYAYDAHGRLTSETTTVFGSLPQTTLYAYADESPDGFVDRRPRRVQTIRDGVTVADTAFEYGFGPDGGRLESVVRGDPVSGTNLVSRREYYPADSENPASRGRVRLAVLEDGTATRYEYAPQGTGFVRTATEGFLTDGAFAIRPGQSSRTLETIDGRGDLVRSETQVHTGSKWALAGWTDYAYNLAHKRTGFTNHRGEHETSEWICTGPVWQEFADGTSLTNVYDAAKRILSTTRTTPFGRVTETFSRDAEGRILATMTATNGIPVRSSAASYDAHGRLVRSVDELGRIRTFRHSADARTTTHTTPSGAIVTTTRHPDGSLAQIEGNARPCEVRLRGVDPASGLAWTEIRTAMTNGAPSVLKSKTWENALGQIVRTDEPAPNGLVRSTLRAYNALGQTVSVREEVAGTPVSPATTYEYDELGRRDRTLRAVGAEWRALDERTDYFTDGTGAVWERALSVASCNDPAIAPLTNRVDRKLSPLSPAQTECIVSYDVRGNATKATETFERELAKTTRTIRIPWATNAAISVSVAGVPVLERDPACVTNRFAYDALGQLLAAFDGRGNATSYAYDAPGRLLSVTDAAGYSTTYAYDAAGRVVATTDPLTNTVYTAYDAADRVVSEWGATYPVHKEYDAYGRWTALETTRDGQTWDRTEWDYDEATGNLLVKRYADQTEVRHTYDPAGREYRKTWARGAWIQNEYDNWGQIIGKTYDDPTMASEFRYDAFGRPVLHQTKMQPMSTPWTTVELPPMKRQLSDRPRTSLYGNTIPLPARHVSFYKARNTTRRIPTTALDV